MEKQQHETALPFAWRLIATNQLVVIDAAIGQTNSTECGDGDAGATRESRAEHDSVQLVTVLPVRVSTEP